jgi:hypothetical protein
MANTDNPRGFQPVGTIDGGECVAHEYILTTGATVYKGDPVIIETAGTVTVAAAGSSVANLGIAAEYVSDSGSAGGKKIMVYDSPNNMYEVQMTTGTSIGQSDVFGVSEIIAYAAGNATTGLSIIELEDPTGAGTAVPWFILRLSPSPDNVWGEHCKVIVKPNMGYFNAGYAGLA